MEQRAYSIGAANTLVSDVGSSFLTASNAAQLATSIVALPVIPGIPDQRTVFSAATNFPAEVEFMEPIRQVEKFTVNIFREDGGQPTLQTGATYLTFKMTCARPNVCLYP
jgi:hypothetical protein